MTPRTKKVVMDALASYRGDDLERAKAAFRGCGGLEMHKEYGQSGSTRQEILDRCERHVAEVSAAISEVEAL